MPNNNGKGRSRTRRRRFGNRNGPSVTPSNTLTRTFRYTKQVTLGNSTGSGDNLISYFSEYYQFDPAEAYGFQDACQTFEYWRLKRGRVKALVGYNPYNATYNTVNLDAAIAMQIWTAADLGSNETVSGVDLQSYHNARVNTCSLNKVTTIVNTAARVNAGGSKPMTILPASTWLDTSQDPNAAKAHYSGFQIFAQMPGITSTNWMPKLQLIFEMDCEFKQPAFQNRPSSFESQIVGSKLEVIPDSAAPETFREYTLTKVELTQDGYNYRLERTDGQSGSLDFNQHDFFDVYVYRDSVNYFNGRRANYTGPPPRKPLTWIPREQRE